MQYRGLALSFQGFVNQLQQLVGWGLPIIRGLILSHFTCGYGLSQLADHLGVADVSAAEAGVGAPVAVVPVDAVTSGATTDFNPRHPARSPLVAMLVKKIVGTTQPVSPFARCAAGGTIAGYTRSTCLTDCAGSPGFARTDLGGGIGRRRLRTPLAGTVPPVVGSGVLFLGTKNPELLALVARVLVRLNRLFLGVIYT